MDSTQRIVFFDGHCHLCTGAVRFIIRRDPKQKFLFSSLQSAYAEKRLAAYQIQSAGSATFYLLEGTQLYQQSTAFLRIMKQLHGGWPLLYYLLGWIPPFLRNAVYRWVSQNRYRWWGRSEQCLIPTPELKARFLA